MTKKIILMLVISLLLAVSACKKKGGSHEVPPWDECTITFEDPPATSDEKETLVEFRLENCEDAGEVAVRRGDLYFPATNIGADDYRRYVPLEEGENLILAVAKNPSGAEAQSDEITITCTLNDPLVTPDSAWIHGAVSEERSEAPIEGALVYVRDVPGTLETGADGTFSFPTPAGGRFLLTVEAGGYTLAQRRAIIDSGHHASVKPVYLVKLDERTQRFTSASGGSLTNSAGDIEVHAPEGAARGDIEVSAVSYPAYRSLPGELPDSSGWTQALELWPEGARFDEPVEVRIENLNGFAPGTGVPAGYYNRDIGAWESQTMGIVSDDGDWIVFSVTHFSPIDANMPAEDRKRAANGKGKKDPCIKGSRGASIIDDFGGQLTLYHPVSFYTEEDEPSGIYLVYNSGAAAGEVDVIIPVDARSASGIEKIEAVLDFEGHLKILSLDSTAAGRYNVAARFPAADFAGGPLPDGIYPIRLDLTKYEYSNYMTAAYFGGAGIEDTGVRTREALPFTSREGTEVFVYALADSPFGAGWNLNIGEKITFNDELGFALLLRGTNNHQPVVTGLPLRDPIRLPQAGDALRAHAYAPDGTLFIVDGDDTLYVSGSRESAASADAVGTVADMVNLFPTPTGVMATNYDLDLISVSAGGQTQVLMDLAMEYLEWVQRQFGDNHPLYYGLGPDLDAGIVADREGVLWMLGIPFYEAKFLISANINADPPEFEVYSLMSFHDEAVPAAICYDAGEHALYYAFFEEGIIRRFDIDAGNESVQIQDDDLLGDPDVMRFQRDGRGNLYVIKTDRFFRYSKQGLKAVFANSFLDQYVLFKDITIEGIVQSIAVMPDGEASFFVFENYDYENFLTLPDPDRGFVNDQHIWLQRDPSGTTITAGGETHEFDAGGRVVSVTDDGGKESRFTYGAEGLTGYTSPYGYETRFVYSDGRVSEIIDPAGRARTLSIDGDNLLVGMTDADGHEVTFQYDASNHLTGKTGGTGSITYTYDGAGSVSEVSLDTGETMQFESILQAARPEGISSEEDSQATFIDGEGNVYRSGYALDGLLSSFSLNGETYEFTHEYEVDFIGWDYDVPVVRYHVTVTRDGREIMKTTYDAHGDIIEHSQYGDTIISNDFDDGDGSLYSAGFYNSLCSLTPDENSLEVYCDEGRYTFYYDENGHLAQFVDEGWGNTYTLTNDENGNPVSIEDPLGGITTLTRDDAGNVTTFEDPDGRTTTYTYTHDNDIRSITDNMGAAFSAEHVHSNTCSGCATSGENMLQAITDPFGRTWMATIRSDGNIADMTTPEGHVTSYTYNGNRMLESITGGDGQSAAFTCNDHSYITAVTLDGETTTYEYDERQNLISAGSASCALAWDRDYDAHTITETVTDEVTGYSQSVTVTYDPEKGVDTALQTDSGLALSLESTGQRFSTISQAGGPTIYLDYNDPYIRNIDVYDSADDSMMSRYIYFDSLKRVESIDVYAGSNYLDGAAYGYGGYADLPSSIAWSEGQMESFTFGYDGVGRITSAAGIATHTYSYDPGGRITNSSHAGAMTYDDDWRVLFTARAIYAYAETGARASRTDLLNGEHWVYDFDALGLLVEVRKYASSTDTIPYSTVGLFYDPLFRLARIDIDGSSRHYQWWEWTLLGEFDGGGSLIRRYIPSCGMDGVGVIQQGGDDFYAVTDVNGSVLKLLDASHNVRASYRYDPYGRILEASGDAAGQPRRFAGALWFDTIGLYYMRLRFLDPEIGQFISRDHLLQLKIEPYGYCEGRPTMCNDPMGLKGGKGGWKASKLAIKQTYSQAEGMAWGPLHPLKQLADGLSGYERGNHRKNGSTALKKIGSITMLEKAPWWKKITKKVEGFWDMVTGGSSDKEKKDPC